MRTQNIENLTYLIEGDNVPIAKLIRVYQRKSYALKFAETNSKYFVQGFPDTTKLIGVWEKL